MLNLNDLYYFVQVVDHKGFAVAARALNLPKSTLNRRIIALETQLGACLIHRTSRHFAVTDAGQEFYQHAVGAIVEAEAAETAIRRRHSEPTGVIRFSCSVSIAQFVLATLLPRFAKQFPKVHIVQHATNRYVDPLEESFDVVIRAHADQLPDSSLIQRQLLFSPRWLVASPNYLANTGMPLAPVDLAGHAGLAYGNAAADTVWRLSGEADTRVAIPYTACLHTDDLMTLLEAAKAGLGVASLPGFMCRRNIAAGCLERVLPEWTGGGANITALLPSRRGLLPSVRAFVDFLVAELPRAMLGEVETTNRSNVHSANQATTLT